MRRVLTYAAHALSEDANLQSVEFEDGREFRFNNADRVALKALAAEMRTRAAGHKGKTIK